MAKKDQSKQEPTQEEKDRAATIAKAISGASEVSETFGEDRDIEDVRKMRTICDTEIVITGWKVLKGDNGEYFFVYAIDTASKQEFGFTCGSAVVMERLNMIKDHGKLPVRGTVKWIKDKYFNFV